MKISCRPSPRPSKPLSLGEVRHVFDHCGADQVVGQWLAHVLVEVLCLEIDCVKVALDRSTTNVLHFVFAMDTDSLGSDLPFDAENIIAAIFLMLSEVSSRAC